MPICKNLGLKPTPKGPGTYEDFFELTKEGDALNLNEYAAWIADTRDTKAYEEYEKDVMNQPRAEGKAPLTEADVPFRSRTHVLCASDFQGKPGLFFNQHIKSNLAEFEKLEGLEGQLRPDRKGRNNVSFFPMMKLPETLQWFKDAQTKDDQHVFTFPKIGNQLTNCATLSSSKYPNPREQVLFDLRDATMKNDHMLNIPNDSLSKNDHFWGDARSRP